MSLAVFKPILFSLGAECKYFLWLEGAVREGADPSLLYEI